MNTHRGTVLHVISSLGLLGGGAERQLALYLQNCTPEWRHVVAYRKEEGILLREAIERLGVRTVWLGAGSFFVQLGRLLTLCRSERVTILHTHLLAANSLGRMAGLIAGIPVVTTLVSTMEVADRVASGAYRQAWKYRLNLALECFTARRTAVFIAISDTVRRSAIRALRLPAERFHIVYRAVQAEIPIVERPTSGGPTLITVGRLVPSKGHDLLLQMLPHVVERWPGTVLQIVGEGPERARLSRVAEELGVTPNVRFLGLRDDVPQLLARADLFVYASWIEGFTLVVAEATAAGLPVVAVDLPVTRETAPPKSVLLVSREVAAFARAVRHALDNLQRLRRDAEEESRICRERFSMSNFVHGTEAVYAEVARMAVRHVPVSGVGPRDGADEMAPSN